MESIKRLFSEIKESAAMNQYGSFYDVYKYNMIDHIIFVSFDLLKFKILFSYCEKKGHEWVDESYGGPDGGCIDMYCRRCGHSHHVKLY